VHLSLYEQAEIFYYAFVFGTLLGVWYDVFRLLRYAGLDSKKAVITQDIAFMSGSAVMCFVFAVLNVNGHFRIFVMLGHLFGLISYRFSIGMVTGVIYRRIGICVKTTSGLCDRLSRGMVKSFNKARLKKLKKKSDKL